LGPVQAGARREAVEVEETTRARRCHDPPGFLATEGDPQRSGSAHLCRNRGLAV